MSCMYPNEDKRTKKAPTKLPVLFRNDVFRNGLLRNGVFRNGLLGTDVTFLGPTFLGSTLGIEPMTGSC